MKTFKAIQCNLCTTWMGEGRREGGGKGKEKGREGERREIGSGEELEPDHLGSNPSP